MDLLQAKLEVEAWQDVAMAESDLLVRRDSKCFLFFG